MTNTLTPNYLYQHYPNIPTSLTSLVSEHTSDALPSKLIHLVRLLASQINNCEFCQNMHIQEALKDGDTQQRIDALPTCESCLCDGPSGEEATHAGQGELRFQFRPQDV